jgi:hypothetical protein
MLDLETNQLADPHCFARQPSVTVEMRLILIDWMQTLHEEQQLHLETLFLAVRLVDLYLSRQIVDSTQLQLLGSAAIYLAAKAEETQPVRSGILAGYAAELFTCEELSAMEVDLFATVDFVVTRPTLCDFLTRYSDFLALSGTVFFMAHYIGELALLLPEAMGMRPSILAAAVVCLARAVTGEHPVWPGAIEKYTALCATEVVGIAQLLNDRIRKLDRYDRLAAREKYASDAFSDVGRTPMPEKLCLI